ncbi:MAG: hypothetical protein FWH26_00205 [Oscillospiraceae bacterium]|nr:hypothetical protein [Oscillospiraceae bacterium]
MKSAPRAVRGINAIVHHDSLICKVHIDRKMQIILSRGNDYLKFPFLGGAISRNREEMAPRTLAQQRGKTFITKAKGKIPALFGALHRRFAFALQMVKAKSLRSSICASRVSGNGGYRY